jgi:hypothetical protein
MMTTHIGLIIGLSYDKITKIMPLFIILFVHGVLKYETLTLRSTSSYGLMQSCGNLVRILIDYHLATFHTS